jgi:L-alanine-DL-glutamate epimerase-like enolase superfamily enzyme
MKLQVRPVRHVLRAPLRAAWGELRVREYLEVRLEWSPGDYGEGEAAPLEPYDGVSLASVRAALDVYAEVLRDDPDDPLEACRRERDLPQALAAIDLAQWDRRSRSLGEPIARLIARDPLSEVPVNATIGAEDRAGAAEQAARAVADGYRTLKVKVGVGDDAGRLAAIRATVGPRISLRADANGAWRTPEEALANLRALAPIGLELCEEPVHGVDALQAVRDESPVPIAMDETHAPGSGAADFVCLKITRGGISGALLDADLARRAGSGFYVASSYDGPRGIAAAVQVAAALRVDRACGLAASAGGPESQNGVLVVPFT